MISVSENYVVDWLCRTSLCVDNVFRLQKIIGFGEVCYLSCDSIIFGLHLLKNFYGDSTSIGTVLSILKMGGA